MVAVTVTWEDGQTQTAPVSQFSFLVMRDGEHSIDNAHSQIQFTVRHMMISKVRGSFQKFDGTVNLDEQNPANTTVNVRIQAASIETRDYSRDAHLRSPDF